MPVPQCKKCNYIIPNPEIPCMRCGEMYVQPTVYQQPTINPKAEDTARKTYREQYNDSDSSKGFSQKTMPGILGDILTVGDSLKDSLLIKIALVVGFAACLLAAEGLERFIRLLRFASLFVDGANVPLYMAILAVSVFCAVLFVLAWFKKLSQILKLIGLACLLVSSVIMFFGPPIPVASQIFVSLTVALICLFFAPTSYAESSTEPAPHREQFQMPQSQYYDDDSHEDNSKKTMAAILCVVAILFAGGVGFYYLRTRSSSPQTASRPAATQIVQPSRNVTPSLDREVTRGRMRYRVSSSWRSDRSADGLTFLYFPFGNNADGFFGTLVSTGASASTIDSVRIDTLNTNLDTIIEVIRNWEGRYSFNLRERTDINGIPVQRYEGRRRNISGMSVLESGFAFVYGNTGYALYALFPETGDSQFFLSTLAQIMNSIVISRYTQAELTGTTVASPPRSAPAAPTTPPRGTPAQPTAAAYQAIFDEYSRRLRAATPRLINEFHAEAARNRDGLMGLARISNAKISQLAAISNAGVSEMAGVMMRAGSGGFSEYQEWSGRLMAVYMEEAARITSAYMAAALR